MASKAEVIQGKMPMGVLPGEYTCVECAHLFVVALDRNQFWVGSCAAIICPECGTAQEVRIPPLPKANKAPKRHTRKHTLGAEILQVGL